MILLRIFLIALVIYLLFRSFFRYFYLEDDNNKKEETKKPPEIKRISKDVGEYVDYEELDKK